MGERYEAMSRLLSRIRDVDEALAERIRRMCELKAVDGRTVIVCPNEFVRAEVKRGLDEIALSHAQLREELERVSVEVDGSVQPAEPPRPPIPSGLHGLNPDYTFETFVVGPNNRMAHAASLAVAEKPGQSYNPLFIWGGVGLGKTHLMHAIGHEVSRRTPGARVVYVSSEKFTNELIVSIQKNTTHEFKQRYRNVDVLLIDDIQFLAGKESTQEEFFHTFNTLYDSKKQIVISSDRPPKEIEQVEERLVSRFAWGIVADIKPPDLETRIAILRKKSEMKGVSVPEEVIFFLAQNIDSNIRELEGALNKVMMYSQLMGRPISLEVVREELAGIVKPRSEPTIELIQSLVAEEMGIKREEMLSERRNAPLALARQIAMYLSRTVLKASLQEIGEAFGKKDHTTVIHACRKIEEALSSDHQVRSIVERVRRRL